MGITSSIKTKIKNMRKHAREDGKYVPTRDELLLMFRNLQDLKCLGCSLEMVLVGPQRERRMLTLQHDRDGRLRFLCKSCNPRHFAYQGDGFYTRRDDGRECKRCGVFKSWDKFYNHRP